MLVSKVNFSGYLYQNVLFSKEDLEQLLILLRPFEFFNTSSVQTQQDDIMTEDRFLNFYERYLHHLFLDQPLDDKDIARMFLISLATSSSCFAKQELSHNRFLLKPIRPVIQLQPLGLFVSSIDKQIHAKTFSKEAQPFGIKISFPTIYEETQSHIIQEIKPDDIEYEKFAAIRQFIRNQTKPLILIHKGEKKVYPIRYSENLKDEISKMKFFEKYEFTVNI